jgi:FkbM family methyltransferase
MRVFLDIGSHTGETIGEVAKRKYRFDRIVCFEPATACLPQLKQLAAKDSRIEVCAFGLGGRNATLELHNPGTLGASVLAKDGPTEQVEIVDAAQWFRANLDPDGLPGGQDELRGSRG